ncbi:MAG: hypothetical protein JXA74_05625, partial [Anaerolineae bacterium]|nr:hypothetical protein [Anaerolineae bacterium]
AGSSRTMAWALVALGLGLTAGPGIYTLIASALIYALVRWLVEGKGRADTGQVRSIRERLRVLIPRRSLLIAGLVALGSATALSLNLGGIGASISLAAQWVRALHPQASSLAWTAFPKALLTYEFLTLALAVAGIVWGLARQDKMTHFFVTWLALALLMGTLLGHREPMWLGDALLPLVVLAGRGAEHLWTRLSPGMTWRDGVALGVVCCFHVFASLELASYIQNGQQEFLWYAYLSWGVLLTGLVVHGFWTGPRAALRTTAGLALIIMGTLILRSSMAVAYQTGRDPREALVGDTISIQVRDLASTLRATSYHRVGDATLVDIEYEESLAAWLAWTLRHYANARALPAITSYTEATVLITRPRAPEARPPGYATQRFRWRETWPEQGLSVREQLRWLLYREPVGYLSPTEIQLWIRLVPGG